MNGNPRTYLALGDSYTIGEAVPLYESFPYQAVQWLRKQGQDFHAPEIIAQTGWTTSELQAGINNSVLLPSYDIVSLLIGVNDQYRNEEIGRYRVTFEQLLQQAIRFASNDPRHVMVLSIPDWSVTPFAAGVLPDKHGRDRQQTAGEIDAYNNINRVIAEKYNTHYIDITTYTREAAIDKHLLAPDQLHPSGKDYSRWAEKLARVIEENSF